MFDLPKKCLVNKFVPKKVFYEKIGVTTKIKDEFVKQIEKIIWLYKIAPDTIGINKTESIEEIQVFEIYVRSKIIPKGVIKTITKAIPYPILFVIKYKEEYCYSINVEDNYYTDWNEILNFNFQGINLEYIYEQIVKKIIKEENTNDKLEIVLENKKINEEIERKIVVLKNKIRQEKQFNKKVELNKELKKLEKEMEELING